ncbi:MAG: hypothetical protein ABI167_10125 [Nitrosospira sp.]
MPKQYNRNEFTYKCKLKDGVIRYDVDYEKGGEKFPMAYDERARMVGQEKKVEFSDIPLDLKLKVEKVLSAHYPPDLPKQFLSIKRVNSGNSSICE